MSERRIAVIGGGRWARIYVRLLLAHADVTVVTPRNVDGMRAWVAAENLRHVHVAADWPQAGEVDAAVIVNAAADHDAATERLLLAGIPLLVEKPFAANGARAAQLADLAAARGAYLAAAQVLRFARYLHRFAERIGSAEAAMVTWHDPATEQRYGDRKSHDAGLPMVVDIVPHILSIFDIVLPGSTLLCHRVEVACGGSAAVLQVSADGIPIAVSLARNAPRRARTIDIARKSGKAVLDFTEEPGAIDLGAGAESGDPAWATRPSPLTQLVAAFVQALGGQPADPRLAAAHGVAACALADAALHQADASLAAWLRQARGGGVAMEELSYAAAEIAARSRRPHLAAIDERAQPIDELISALEALRASR